MVLSCARFSSPRYIFLSRRGRLARACTVNRACTRLHPTVRSSATQSYGIRGTRRDVSAGAPLSTMVCLSAVKPFAVKRVFRSGGLDGYVAKSAMARDNKDTAAHLSPARVIRQGSRIPWRSSRKRSPRPSPSFVRRRVRIRTRRKSRLLSAFYSSRRPCACASAPVRVRNVLFWSPHRGGAVARPIASRDFPANREDGRPAVAFERVAGKLR